MHLTKWSPQKVHHPSLMIRSHSAIKMGFLFVNGDTYFCKKASNEISLGEVLLSHIYLSLDIQDFREDLWNWVANLFFEFFRNKQANLNQHLTCELLIGGWCSFLKLTSLKHIPSYTSTPPFGKRQLTILGRTVLHKCQN